MMTPSTVLLYCVQQPLSTKSKRVLALGLSLLSRPRFSAILFPLSDHQFLFLLNLRKKATTNDAAVNPKAAISQAFDSRYLAMSRTPSNGVAAAIAFIQNVSLACVRRSKTNEIPDSSGGFFSLPQSDHDSLQHPNHALHDPCDL